MTTRPLSDVLLDVLERYAHDLDRLEAENERLRATIGLHDVNNQALIAALRAALKVQIDPKTKELFETILTKMAETERAREAVK